MTNASIPTNSSRDPRYRRWRWQIFGITWLAYAGFYLTRKSFSVAKIEMAKESGLGLSSEQLVAIDAPYLITYAIGQFIWGMCGDRFGPRKVVLTGMMVSVLAAVAMGASSLVLALGFFFAIQGLCQSTGWAPLAKNFSYFFSRRERGTMMGLWCTNYAVGGLVASVFAGYAGDQFGYRYAFYLPAGALLLVWVLFLILQRDRPETVGLAPIVDDAPRVDTEAGDKASTEVSSWDTSVKVYKNPTILMLAGAYLFLKPTRYAVLFWGPFYMSERLGTNMLESGLLSSLFEVAGVVSVFAAGAISDRVFGSRRMPVCVISLLALSMLLYTMHLLPANALMMGACFFLIGFLLFAPDSIVSGTAAVDFGTSRGAGTACGLVNGCGSVGAIFGGTIPGLLKDSYGWGTVFFVLASSTALAGLILAFKWNALPRSATHEQ